MTTNYSSTIAILGGAGKAGRPLVQEVLNAGLRIRLLLRHPEQFDLTDERMDIIQGDARDLASIQRLLDGCDALLSTLGHPKGEAIPIMTAVTEHIICSMKEFGIGRYVVVTSLYDTQQEQQDLKTKQAAEFMQQHYPLFMDDRRTELKLLTESELNWTYVRTPYIVQGVGEGKTKVHLNHLPGEQIKASDLAHFLLTQLNSNQYSRQAPFVANG